MNVTTDPIDIVLHAGAHKTATTHLQSMITRQRPALNAQKIGFWGPNELRLEQGGLRGMLGLTSDEARVPHLDKYLDGFDRVVFSEENLFGRVFQKTRGTLYPQARLAVQQFVDFVAPHRVHLAISTRNPYSFLTSAYGQAMMGGNIMPWSEFASDIAWWKYRWTRVLRPIVEDGLCASITIWRYEDYHDLTPEILRTLLGADHPAIPIERDEVLNNGLSRDAVRNCLKWHREGREGRLGFMARAEFPVTDDNPKFQPWGDYQKGYATSCYDRDMVELDELDGIRVL